MVIIGASLLLLLFMGLVEFARHRRNLDSIPIRVHVNGTRGKTTTTRLIAAGLRGAGLRVLAKTTGSMPCLIREDGSQVPLRRRGPANIIEQMRVVALAARQQVDALVVECMAIQPEMQWVSERRLMRAHICVITNVRLDHTDHMGGSRESVAEVLALTIPSDGTLITGALDHLELFSRRAGKMNTRVVGVAADAAKESCLKHLGYSIHPQNAALALETCCRLGLPQETAFKGMAGFGGEPESLRTYRLGHGGRTVYLVNAFDANDPQSTLEALADWRAQHETGGVPPDGAILVGLFNNRMDRGFRVALFTEHFLTRCGIDDFVVCGQSPRLVRRKMLRAGKSGQKIMAAGTGLLPRRAQKLLDRIIVRYGRNVVLFGFGNIKGMGQELVDYFKANGTSCQ